jgi:hypothetical protein
LHIHCKILTVTAVFSPSPTLCHAKEKAARAVTTASASHFKDNQYRRSVWHPFQVKFVVLKPAPLYLEQGDNST